jgi:hypothetical protein
MSEIFPFLHVLKMQNRRELKSEYISNSGGYELNRLEN